jgi:hypothetical protein
VDTLRSVFWVWELVNPTTPAGQISVAEGEKGLGGRKLLASIAYLSLN